MSTVTQKTDAETSGRKPPELHPNLDLLKSEKLPSQSKPWPERELPVDVLVVTGESCELLSCLSHLNKGSIYKSYKMAIGHVFFGKIGQQNELMKIAVMECSVGSTDTSLTVLDAVQELGPKAVFCVGFCGGLDDTKVNLGDVVISKMVRTYTSVSVMEEGTMDRNIGVPVPSYIGGVLKRADDSWIPPLKNPLELDPIRHKDGVFLSGPEEVNNKKRCDELVKHFSDAIAIERQGEGKRCEILGNPKCICSPLWAETSKHHYVNNLFLRLADYRVQTLPCKLKVIGNMKWCKKLISICSFLVSLHV